MSENRLSVRTVILGGGLTGLSAAWHLRDQDCILLERDDRVGGLALTDVYDGFSFDRGSHVWFTSSDYAEAFVDDLPGFRMQTHIRSAWVHAYDQLVPAPFQANLHGLPLPIVSECLIGYIEATREPRKHANSFGAWLQSCFGEGIYRHFMKPYNSKVWTVCPEELATDWQACRVDVPDVAELINGAIGLSANPLGANATFGYPDRGGTEAIVKAMLGACSNILCQADAISIDLDAKLIKLRDGRTIEYGSIVSTIPLPTLIQLVREASPDLIDAAGALRSTQVVLVNIALKTKPEHGHHWIYFPESKYPFFRVSFPHNYSDYMCPDGAGSIHAECAFPQNADIDLADVEESARAALAQAGYLDTSQLLFTRAVLAKPAYVLCDHARRKNLDFLVSYMRTQGVYCCGRFGGWDYINMDQCIVIGQEAADWARTVAG